jgi:NAD(P)-dependent dehydrogenase (short-subunit alcohol dehydrogenase family)
MSEKKLSGKVALVTGASKGLGKATALALGREGAKVVLASRNLEMLNGVAREIQDAGGEAFCFATDVTSEIEVKRLEESVVKQFGKLQILVNNAGMNLRKSITEFTLAEWHQVIDTNLTSAFLMCRAFVPHMKGQNYGRIINMTSIMSHVAIAGRTAYAASKTGLLGFTRALALELAPERVTVNGISPGVYATELNKPLLENPEVRQQFFSRIPLARWGEPAEIGALAVYLCSEEAGFITGTDILTDGGWTAQ